MWGTDTTAPTEAPQAAPVIDRRTMPPGVVPRHLQQWVLIGLTVVMVGILAFSPSPTKPRMTTAASPAASAVDANPQRIEDYARRIQEEAQRLTAEEASLARTKQQMAAAGSVSPLPASTAPTPGGGASDRGLSERVQREERALLADNVAFSRAVPAMPTAASPASVTPATAATTPSAADRRPAYRLLEGTVIETVLTNRLDATFSGPVNCLVTTAVYAADAQHLLVPPGARVLGEAKPVNTFGQSRVAVVFHRLILPNGTSLDLHEFHGLNQGGDVGLQDQVNRHYAQIFGASLAVGAIAGLAQAQTSVGVDATTFDVYRQGAAANLAQSSARILDRFLNLLPTVTIREGHRIKVYLSNDLELPAYRDTRLTTGGGR